MLDQEIPMKWVAVIFLTLAACGIFGWWVISPSAQTVAFNECMAKPDLVKKEPDEKGRSRTCAYVVAGRDMRRDTYDKCNALYVKCRIVLRDFVNIFATSTTDVMWSFTLHGEDKWGNLQRVVLTRRFVRPDDTSLDWKVAAQEVQVGETLAERLDLD